MKRSLALILALCLCLTAHAALAAELGAADYTTAGKLLKQLWAGSGFSGTLRLEILPRGEDGNFLTTKQPLDFALDYIYVRADAVRGDEHRLDLSLGGDTQAHLSLKDGTLALSSSLIGADWYTLPATVGLRPSEGENALPDFPGADELSAERLTELTGMPALVGYMLPIALRLGERAQELQDITDSYATRIDLWIEGYRQSAVLGKLEDGVSTMTTSYIIPPAAIKAQAKQLVLDLMGNNAALAKLASAIGAENAALLLEPKLQKYYFDAIDALPLEGDMAIERTVSLKGETLTLKISLPLYDARGGAGTLMYDRESGRGEMPDRNVIELATEAREASVTYRAFESEEGVKVWQGSLLSRANGAGSFSVGEEEQEPQSAAPDTLAADFTLTLKETVGRDTEDRDTLDYDIGLELEPQAELVKSGEQKEFEPLNISLSAHFASKTLKTASTEMYAKLTIGGDGRDSVTELTIAGKTRKKWTPEPVPASAKDVTRMTDAEAVALLPGMITRGGALLTQYFNLPVESTDEGMDEPADGGNGSVDGTSDGGDEPTPVIFPTLAP